MDKPPPYVGAVVILYGTTPAVVTEVDGHHITAVSLWHEIGFATREARVVPYAKIKPSEWDWPRIPGEDHPHLYTGAARAAYHDGYDAGRDAGWREALMRIQPFLAKLGNNLSDLSIEVAVMQEKIAEEDGGDGGEPAGA